MTGTAETEAGEFWDIYKLDVVTIPTNKPVARIDMNDRVYKTKREKYTAVIDEIQKLVVVLISSFLLRFVLPVGGPLSVLNVMSLVVWTVS